MGKIQLILLISLLNFTFVGNKQVFKDLSKKTNLKSGEYLAILFMRNGDCPKCYDLSFKILNQLEKHPKYFKIVGAIECFREIELKIFKRDFDWKYYLYVDDGKLREKLGENKSCILLIIDSQGEKKVSVSQNNLKMDLKHLQEFLNKL